MKVVKLNPIIRLIPPPRYYDELKVHFLFLQPRYIRPPRYNDQIFILQGSTVANQNDTRSEPILVGSR